MIWVLLASLSYFLTAIVQVVDKYIIDKKVRSPLTLAFYVGVLSSFSFFFWFFDFSLISPWLFSITFLAGLFFFLAVFFFSRSLLRGSVSRVASIVGGISPIFVLVLSYLFFDEALPALWMIAFGFLIVGSVFLAVGKGFRLKMYSVLAALFFAIHYFLSKWVYIETTFLNGFAWIRVGVVFASLLVLLFPVSRRKLRSGSLHMKKRVFWVFVSNKGASAGASLLLNYSISIGSVVIINALQGIQYASVFLLALIFSLFWPGIISESYSFRAMFQKILGIMFVSLGVVLLFLFR